MNHSHFIKGFFEVGGNRQVKAAIFMVKEFMERYPKQRLSTKKGQFAKIFASHVTKFEKDYSYTGLHMEAGMPMTVLSSFCLENGFLYYRLNAWFGEVPRPNSRMIKLGKVCEKTGKIELTEHLKCALVEAL